MEFILRNLPSIFIGIYFGRILQKLFPVQPKRWKRLTMYLLMYITFTIPSWLGDENPALLFPFFMLTFLFCLTGDKLSRLVMGGIFFTLLLSLNMVLDSLYRTDASLAIMLAFKIVAWCLLALLLTRIALKGSLQLSKKLWLLLGGLALGPLMTTLSLSLWNVRWIEGTYYDFYKKVLRVFGFTILPFALFSSLALLIAAAVLSRHEALEQENKLSALREVYYMGLRQEQVGLRTLRHDLKNHVTALQGLLEQGKQEELSRYLAHLYESPALGSGKRYAKNETANVVICSKAAQIEALGLTADFEVSLPETLPIPAPELCALLGNAIDNAIEGSAGAKRSTITLRAKLEKGMFMLRVANPIGGEISPGLVTTKADTSLHGYGLACMRDIAQRHGGSFEATARDGNFLLLICFPCN